MNISDMLIGRRLANRDQGRTRISWFAGVAAMGLDGLSSASYGPEAALVVLLPLGAAGPAMLRWVMAPILALLAILYFSYRQTIVAYPVNGGAYTVAKANLGTLPALLSAAALMIDYVLNVAVGISAGVGALTSSIPALQPWTLTLCLAILIIVTVANLRGTAEAGLLFAFPTYLFALSLLAIIVMGLAEAVAAHGHPHAIVAPHALARPAKLVGAWLILRAFAAGCTAMTGVEAVSNGVSALREPVVREAHLTLTIICGLLALLLAGIATVAGTFDVSAMDQTQPGYQSVLSQIAGAVVGRGIFYYVAMASVLAVLCLSANTSFVGFPRLCRLVAQDGYLPRPFAVYDRRLVFSVGIWFLAITAGALLIAFGGITDRLIPLFAIGAFLTFTLSQTGMVVHWYRQKQNHGRLTINGIGAITTLIALLVILAAKFMEGAWIVVITIPSTIAGLILVRRYYAKLDARLTPGSPFEVPRSNNPVVIVPFMKRDLLSDRALKFAMRISNEIVGVHFLGLGGPEEDDDHVAIRQRWDEEIVARALAKGLTAPRLVLLSAPYRSLEGPIIELMQRIRSSLPNRMIAIMIPELILTRWWERFFHTRRAVHLRSALLAQAQDNVMIVTAPLHSTEDEQGVSP